VNQGSEKISKELMDDLSELTESDVIDVLMYVKKPAAGFDEYLQAEQEKGELRFNYLEYADCYVVEASKQLLLELADREEVSRMTVNPRFGVQ
jgi:hypothetical protein